MIVENTSVISKEDAYNSLYVSTKNNLMKKYIYSALGLIAGAVLLTYGLLVLDSQWISVGAIVAAIGFAHAIYTTVLIFKSPKDIKKKNKEICENGITYQFKFHEHSLDLVCLTTTKKNKLSYKYEEFKKVYELDDKYEIHLANTEIMYVLKSGFQNERMIQYFEKNLKTNKKLKIVKKTTIKK